MLYQIQALTTPTGPAEALAQPTLCVDLDHTLLATDMLYESLVRFVSQHPRKVWRVPLWLLAGRARLKRELASHIAFDPQTLPVNTAFLRWLETERVSGRSLALVSAADQELVNLIAARFNLFDTVIGSDGRTNLRSKHKLAAIKERFGETFDYAGDSAADRSIFKEARYCILVGNAARLASKLPAGSVVEQHFPSDPGSKVRNWITALRCHQWAKNLLVFVPVLLAGLLTGVEQWASALLAWLMLNLFASAGYVVNDLLDLDADREHQSKRQRPFAAGALRISDGLAVVPILIVSACLIGTLLPAKALALGLLYFLISLTYSLELKRIAMLDVVVLAGLFTIRILMGVVATGIALSFWLLSFSMFFFLSLALVKRYAELIKCAKLGGAAIPRRGYAAEDIPLLAALGGGSVMASCGIFVSYLVNEQFPRQIYDNPSFLWLVFPLILFWKMRIWHITVRGRMSDDPVLFALRDRTSRLLGLVVFACLAMAW